jgi:hypothetical protein
VAAAPGDPVSRWRGEGPLAAVWDHLALALSGGIPAARSVDAPSSGLNSVGPFAWREASSALSCCRRAVVRAGWPAVSCPDGP